MKKKLLAVKVLSTEASLFEGEVSSVSLPGSVSPFQVLPQHGSLISLLEEGKIRIVFPNGEETFLDIPGGVVRVENNRVEVCVF